MLESATRSNSLSTGEGVSRSSSRPSFTRATFYQRAPIARTTQARTVYALEKLVLARDRCRLRKSSTRAARQSRKCPSPRSVSIDQSGQEGEQTKKKNGTKIETRLNRVHARSRIVDQRVIPRRAVSSRGLARNLAC